MENQRWAYMLDLFVIDDDSVAVDSDGRGGGLVLVLPVLVDRVPPRHLPLLRRHYRRPSPENERTSKMSQFSWEVIP